MPDQIEALEDERENVHQRLADPALYQGDGTEVAAAKKELTVLEETLATAYVRWEELTQRAEA